MTFGEQMKHKADEVNLQGKAKDFGDAVIEVLKAAVGLAAGYAAENREKVDGALDKAAETIEQKTGGKHADTVTKVRATVDKGIDKLVEQKPQPKPKPEASTPPVPDDTFSAFDDGAPSGSPSQSPTQSRPSSPSQSRPSSPSQSSE
ncbi:MAG TPA: antitoxin [Intrasporangium sp.]|uniref:antitoxin n=1 Tax=Intrasporangium sp. TaxID=1925024 RepID=UPI002B49FEF3|nr:antitoxin [Intrasporangium sp.]HKX68794.1 antitoxin [Intrasporangium sp.]